MDNSDTLTVNQARQQVASEFEEYFVGNKSTSNPQRALDIYVTVKVKPLVEFAHDIVMVLIAVQTDQEDPQDIIQELIDRGKSIMYFVDQEEKESAFYATSREA